MTACSFGWIQPCSGAPSSNYTILHALPLTPACSAASDNVALGKLAFASSFAGSNPPSNAVDGSASSYTTTLPSLLVNVSNGLEVPVLSIDLGRLFVVRRIIVRNRADW